MDRICAVQASRLYITLLQLPGSGSGGHKLFHPMIFQKALNVFYLYPESGKAGSSGSLHIRGGGKGSRSLSMSSSTLRVIAIGYKYVAGGVRGESRYYRFCKENEESPLCVKIGIQNSNSRFPQKCNSISPQNS